MKLCSAFVGLFLLARLACQAAAVDTSSARAIVRQYIEKDLQGDRLSSQKWKENILPLYYDPETDEPWWDTMTVIKNYKIVNAEMKNDTVLVTVKYDILCDITTEVSTHSRTKPVVVYSLKERNKILKLMDYETCPIVSKETAINDVTTALMKSQNDEEMKTQYQNTLRDLQKLK